MEQFTNRILDIGSEFMVIADNLSDAIISINETGKIIYANKAAEKIFGYGQKELLGEELGKLVPVHLRSKHFASYVSYLKTGRKKSDWECIQVNALNRMGDEFPVEVSIAEFMKDGSRIFTGVIRDISVRKKTEERINLLAHAVESSSDLICVTNLENKITFVNKAFIKAYGYEANELIGKDAGILDSPANPPELRKEIYTRSRISDWSGELLNRRKDGTEFPIWLSTSRITDGFDHIVGLLGVARDISEQREYKEKLEETNRKLQQFDYAVSHDLKEPLRVISGFSRLVQKKAETPVVNEYIGFIRSAVDRMEKLLSDLLTFSRLTSKELPHENVDCNEVMKAVTENLSVAIKESRASVKYENLPVVKAASSHILQLFQNLVSNALKFKSSEPPEVRISAERRNGEYKFAVKDNGIGIDPEYKDKIFTVFQRLHSYDEYPGTGIGLSLCKEIVEMYGGKIWLESAQGKGTIFYFTIPVLS